jgi:hypothetical protein
MLVMWPYIRKGNPWADSDTTPGERPTSCS